MANVKTTKTRNIIPYFRKIVRNYSICFCRHLDILIAVLSELTAHRDTEKKSENKGTMIIVIRKCEKKRQERRRKERKKKKRKKKEKRLTKQTN